MIDKKIEQLQKATSDSDVIRQLQNIGKDILTNYIIKLGSDKGYLIPVWIEAYCYKKDCFEDQACDGARRKKAIVNILGKTKNIWENIHKFAFLTYKLGILEKR